jgi:hypothetical protein
VEKLQYERPCIIEIGSVTGLTLGNVSSGSLDCGEWVNNPDEPNTKFNAGDTPCEPT